MRFAIWESDPQLHLYMRVNDDFDIRARMFAPLSGVPEDPATGSASCALAGLLAHYKEEPNGSFSWRIAQGVEMGASEHSYSSRRKGRRHRSSNVGRGLVRHGKRRLHPD